MIELETALSAELWANSQAYVAAFRDDTGETAVAIAAKRSEALLGYLVGQADSLTSALRTCDPASRPTWSRLALPLARGIAAALRASPRWIAAGPVRESLAALVASAGIDDLLVLAVLGGGKPFKSTASVQQAKGP